MKTELTERVATLKKENDQASQYLQNLDQERAKVVSECLVRNGRILELEAVLKIITDTAKE